jgi:hypothetical protein
MRPVLRTLLVRTAHAMGNDLDAERTTAHEELLARLKGEIHGKYRFVVSLTDTHGDPAARTEANISVSNGRATFAARVVFDGALYFLKMESSARTLPIEFDGEQMVGTEIDSAIAPTPGQPLPRRDAVDVIMITFCDVLAHR